MAEKFISYLEKSFLANKELSDLYSELFDKARGSNHSAWDNYAKSNKQEKDLTVVINTFFSEFVEFAEAIKQELTQTERQGLDPARMYEIAVTMISQEIFKHDYKFADFITKQADKLIHSLDLTSTSDLTGKDLFKVDESRATQILSTVLLAYCCAIQCIRKSNENIDAGVYASSHYRSADLIGIPIAYFFKSLAMIADGSNGSENELRYGYELSLAALNRFQTQPGMLNLVADYELKLSRLISKNDEKIDLRLRALNHVEKAIQIDPDYPSYYKLRSEIFTDLSNYQRAVSDLNIAIRLTKTHADNSQRVRYESALESLQMFESGMSQVRNVQMLGEDLKISLAKSSEKMENMEETVGSKVDVAERQIEGAQVTVLNNEKRIDELNEELKNSKREQLQYMAIIASVIAIIQTGLTVVTSAANANATWRFWVPILSTNAITLIVFLIGINWIATRDKSKNL